MDIIQGIETGIIIYIHEDTQLFRGDISNKKKPYKPGYSKVKRQLKKIDDNRDTEKLITKLANVINFWAKLPCAHNSKDSNKDLNFLTVICYDSSALGRTV